MKNISIVIIAKDAQDHIGSCLDSLKSFDDVVVYLNNSTDATEKIAQTYKNVNVIQGEFIGFGPTKNAAAQEAKSDWILSLDSDEELSQSLIDEIQKLSLEDIKEVFVIKRDNYFLGKQVKYSGWGNDYLVRIYNRSYHLFTDAPVHEKIELKEGSIQTRLKNSFKHHAVDDINQFLFKISKYSDLAAKDKKTCSFSIVILKSLFAFFKTYILQLGLLDGWRGFVIALSNFNGKFFRYTKRYINCKH